MSSPAVAAVLSAIIPGLGQLYAGRLLRAILFIVMSIVVAATLGPLVLIVSLVAVYDAVKVAG